MRFKIVKALYTLMWHFTDKCAPGDEAYGFYIKCKNPKDISDWAELKTNLKNLKEVVDP